MCLDGILNIYRTSISMSAGLIHSDYCSLYLSTLLILPHNNLILKAVLFFNLLI